MMDVIDLKPACPASPLGVSLLIVSLVGLTLCMQLRAADEPTTQPAAARTDNPRIAQWFSELASTDPATREHARDCLMRLKRNDLLKLQQLLRKSQHLAPSQIVSLRQIVQEVYLAGEPYEKDIDQSGAQHGFLGILMDTDVNADVQQPNESGRAPGIVVGRRYPGFCAARVLRDGDVILASLNPDNTPEKIFNNFLDFRAVISLADPGSIIRLQVLRQGQIIQVSLTLDCRPKLKDETVDALDDYCNERQQKFDQYWNATFAPLLHESVG